MTNLGIRDSGGEGHLDGDPLIQGCLHGVGECEQLLAVIPQSVFIAVSNGNSPIGAHLRHILDRYQCFFSGIYQGHIDYDDRKRDKSIETNVEAASFALSSIQRRFSAFSLPEYSGKNIRVSESVYHDGECVVLISTIDRELMGLISHSTHHLAIIGLIAKSLGYQMSSDFGKAASTILFERA